MSNAVCMTNKYLVIVYLILLEKSSNLEGKKAACLKDELRNKTTQEDYKYLYNYLTGTGAHNFSESITIGFLGAYGQAQVVLGALPLAIDAINQNKDLLPGRKLYYVAADIGTNPAASGLARRKSSLAARAIRVMTEMRDNGTIAFIGPDDTCSSEALVAAAWNLPMISYKCSDTRVSEKRVFYTFARTLPPSSKVSKSVVSLLIAFNWRKFVVVSGSHPASGSEVKEAIKELSEAHGLTVTDTKQYSDYIPRHIDQMDLIVGDTYKRTRVYVFVGEHIALVDFVKCLQRRKLLDSGDYVVISVDDEIYDPNRRIKIIQRDYLDPFLSESWGNLSDYMGFRSVLKLTPSHPRNPSYKTICEQIKLSSARPPFCVPYHSKIFDSISVPIQAAYLYDAVMIYARALTEIFDNNEDPRNGTAILQRILNRSYRSVQGYDVFIDGNGDAEGNFTVVALLDDQEMNGSLRMSMQPVGYFQYNGSNSPLSVPEFKYLDLERPIQWVGGKLPRAEPICGFKGEKCIYKTDWRPSAGILFVSILFLIAGLFFLKHYRYEQKLACLLWKIDMKDVTIIPTETAETTTKNMIQVCRHSVFQAPTGSIAEMSESSPKRAYTRIGLYKGNIVAIKKIHKKSVDLTRSIRKELKQIREVRHENLIPFVGACVDHGQVAILTAYCARGSLEDVLANEDLHLDNMFVSSLVTDVLKGMIYLHDSVIISHGNLRSSNCLIDSRWVLQITDFGLTEFRAGEVDDPDRNVVDGGGSGSIGAKTLRRCLYRAPELLRDATPPARGTQKGDVYAFGFLLYEIIGRHGPWGHVQLTPYAIIDGVKMVQAIPFRPDLESLGAAEYITKCIKMCWHEEPEQRPDIRYCRVILKEMQAGLKPNIFDNMLAIMEKYAYNLEGLVQERTNQLTEEKKKTDALLHRMLPKTVADALKRGDRVEAESFDCVTIYFSDIVGFTELSAVSTPLQVIDLLNDLYTCFDSIISHYDVYKVETIGDAYMVVSGLPLRNGDRHAGEIASMALHLLSKIKKFEIKHRSGELLQLRIGIHSGHCVAGVVGLKMPRYCLFGDTVNTASRMESSGESLRIHISHATYMLLQRLGGYRFEERGLIPIKGKGEMRTYWLMGEDPAQRLARIREEMLGSSLFSSISSDNLSETPDLIRRPGLPPICSLTELHERARKACSSVQLTPSKVFDMPSEAATLKSEREASTSASTSSAADANNYTVANVNPSGFSGSDADLTSDDETVYDPPPGYSVHRRHKHSSKRRCRHHKRRCRKRRRLMQELLEQQKKQQQQQQQQQLQQLLEQQQQQQLLEQQQQQQQFLEQQQQSQIGIEQMPDEIFCKILSYVSYEDLGANVRLVNHKFKSMAHLKLRLGLSEAERKLKSIGNMAANWLDATQDDTEVHSLCKMFNMIEYLKLHYDVLLTAVWPHLPNSLTPAGTCMYGGVILDMLFKFVHDYMYDGNRIYGLVHLRDNEYPYEVNRISQQIKHFVLYFDRVSEQPFNHDVFFTGCKAIDILDCAREASKTVIVEKIENDILTYKVRYNFRHSWLVAISTPEIVSKSWNEKIRFLYMRIRRIVTSHSELHMEYANYRRELALRSASHYRIKMPQNSVYTGYGEVGDRFYYYGTMNEGLGLNTNMLDMATIRTFTVQSPGFGAFSAKFDSLAAELNPDPYNPDGLSAKLAGLTITVEVKCPLYMGPRLLLRKMDYESRQMFAPTNDEVHNEVAVQGNAVEEDNGPNEEHFDMCIDFDYPGGMYPRLPTSYSIVLNGSR